MMEDMEVEEIEEEEEEEEAERIVAFPYECDQCGNPFQNKKLIFFLDNFEEEI